MAQVTENLPVSRRQRHHWPLRTSRQYYRLLCQLGCIAVFVHAYLSSTGSMACWRMPGAGGEENFACSWVGGIKLLEMETLVSTL